MKRKQVTVAIAVLSALDAGGTTAADIAKGTRSTPKQVGGALMSLVRKGLAKRTNPKAKPGTPAVYRIMAKGKKARKVAK